MKNGSGFRDCATTLQQNSSLFINYEFVVDGFLNFEIMVWYLNLDLVILNRYFFNDLKDDRFVSLCSILFEMNLYTNYEC